MQYRNQERHDNSDKRTWKRYTYRDCLEGTVPMPGAGSGSTLFQLLMVGGMVTFMVTVNGLRDAGPVFPAVALALPGDLPHRLPRKDVRVLTVYHDDFASSGSPPPA